MLLIGLTDSLLTCMVEGEGEENYFPRKDSLVIPTRIKNKLFMATKAGKFSKTPLATVKAWTDAEIIKPVRGTTGTGDRRKYSVMNCIEIGIAKAMSDKRVALKHIKKSMQALRQKKDYKRTELEYLLNHHEGFLVIHVDQDRIMKGPSYSAMAYNQGDEIDIRGWFSVTAPWDCDQVAIFNINRIAQRVIDAID